MEIQGQTPVALDNVHMWVILAEDQQETDCKAYDLQQWLGNERCGVRFSTDARIYNKVIQIYEECHVSIISGK